MKVSVVIPLYNKSAYVGRALDSVLSQEFQDFEVIVIDDGSTDDGASVARSYKDSRLRIVTQPNSGPGAARNRGLREARGAYVAFLDADDAWLADFLTSGLQLLDTFPQAASVTSGYIDIPPGKSTEPLWRSRGLYNGVVRLLPRSDPPFVVALLAYMTPCTTIVRTETIKRFGGFYDRGRCRYGEDAFLWLKVLLNEQVAIDLAPRTLVYRNASALSGNLSGARQIEPFLDNSDEIKQICPPHLAELLNQVLAIRAFKTACVLGYWGEWRAAARLRRSYARSSDRLLPYELASLICATPAGSLLGAIWRQVMRARTDAAHRLKS
ncbi:glycosyltransferase [Mesorhizobium sp. BAC0120]|uniref:glycosyltransferase family 2 protein n=1 Tax=Mesorhizobium sp. BAC0120 TaxID=3090670 RepID=UPI00298D2A30|nr:glycosyltransferase [Mesorhizobium sp. BAC0120]MDW6023085.1 glycosyltransferase [Mesorhizobium sp. BAC0120]